ncbi:MAG: TonB-dependent receptor [Mariprofundales bacterium]
MTASQKVVMPGFFAMSARVVAKVLRHCVPAMVLLLRPNLTAAQDLAINQLMTMPLADLMELEVTTASRQPEPLAKAPAHIVVITRRQIRARGYRNLLDLLEDQPGFLIQRSNTPGSRFNTITWRGLRDTNHFQLMMDGVRVDSPSGEPFAIDDNFPLDQAQRVEMVYGPASSLYGSAAAAGVINIITERPIDHPTATIHGATGSFGQRRIFLDAATPLGAHASLSLSALSQRSDTANLPRYYPQEYIPVDATTFGGTVAVAAANRESYRAPIRNRSLYGRLHVGEHFTLMAHQAFNRHSTASGYSLANSLYVDQAHWSNDLTTVAAIHQWQITAGLGLRSELHGNQFEVKPDSGFLNIYTDFNHYYKYARTRSAGIDEQLHWQHGDHAITLGLAYDGVQSIPKTADLPTPYQVGAGSQGQGMVYANTNLPIQLFELRYHTIGLFGQFKSDWGGGLSTTLGLRYDKDSRFVGSFNPRASLVYRMPSGVVTKLLYAEAFRSPSTQDSYENFGSFSGAKDAAGRYSSAFFHVPNTALRPEKVRDLELELDAPLGGAGNARVSLYHYWTQSLILPQIRGANSSFIPGSIIAATEVNTNVGNSRHDGAELTLDWQHRLGMVGKLRLWGSYSYLHATISQPGAATVDLPYMAAHQGRVGLTLDYQQWLEITPRLRLIGRTNGPKSDPAAPGRRLQVPGYAIVDLHLAAHGWSDRLSGALDVCNLLDRRYFHTGGLASASFKRVAQPPRSILATLELSL